IRTLIAERTDPTLFAMSYDYVGDLSETVALMWRGRGQGRRPSRPGSSPPPPPTMSRDVQDGGRLDQHAQRELERAVQCPTLSEVVTTLASLGKTDLPRQLSEWLDDLDEVGRWALLKLVTGALRIGVSARLAKTAVAALGSRDADDIEIIWPSLQSPYGDLFA